MKTTKTTSKWAGYESPTVEMIPLSMENTICGASLDPVKTSDPYDEDDLG